MRGVRTIIGSTVGLALLAASVSPAMARDRHYRGYGYGYGHRHDDGFGFGDAVGIAALIGAVAIVAKSMSKDKASRNGGSYEGDSGDYADNETHSDNGHAPNGAPLPDSPSSQAPKGSGDLLAEDEAVDACAQAARDEATTSGGYAEVRSVEASRVVADGWDIDGRVEQRRNYRDTSGDTRRFTCSVRNGRVAEVYISHDLV